MAWSTRDQIKRKFRQASGNLDTAQTHLLDCLNIYVETDNNQHAELTNNIMEAIEVIKHTIEQSIKRI